MIQRDPDPKERFEESTGPGDWDGPPVPAVGPRWIRIGPGMVPSVPGVVVISVEHLVSFEDRGGGALLRFQDGRVLQTEIPESYLLDMLYGEPTGTTKPFSRGAWEAAGLERPEMEFDA